MHINNSISAKVRTCSWHVQVQYCTRTAQVTRKKAYGQLRFLDLKNRWHACLKMMYILYTVGMWAGGCILEKACSTEYRLFSAWAGLMWGLYAPAILYMCTVLCAGKNVFEVEHIFTGRDFANLRFINGTYDKVLLAIMYWLATKTF